MRIVACVLFTLLLATLPARADDAVRLSVKGRFEEVKERVVAAIENRGIVVNTTAHIGEMLARTGRDLGATRQVYLHAEALEFCSAVVSRRMMEADPHQIVFCPYVIAIYVLPEDPGTVHVAYRRPAGSGPGAAALAEVDRLLGEIVREATEW